MEDAPRAISVLIDEDLDIRLRHHFGPSVRAETVQCRRWKGLKNGRLLQAIRDAGDVHVFVTGDQQLPHQQNVPALPFAVVVLRAGGSLAIDDLLPLMPELRRRLPALASRPGVVAWVDPPSHGHTA